MTRRSYRPTPHESERPVTLRMEPDGRVRGDIETLGALLARDETISVRPLSEYEQLRRKLGLSVRWDVPVSEKWAYAFAGNIHRAHEKARITDQDAQELWCALARRLSALHPVTWRRVMDELERRFLVVIRYC